jgi:hypothetical protein
MCQLTTSIVQSCNWQWCCSAACVDAAIAALGIEPSTAAPGEVTSRANVAAAAAAAAGGGPVKDEAGGVKRERGADDDEYVPRSATAADRIDLTEEVRNLIAVGQPGAGTAACMPTGCKHCGVSIRHAHIFQGVHTLQTVAAAARS